MMGAKTFSPKPRDIERRWYVVDADGAVLGRLASEVAKILRGKHKPIFAPHADTGDHVIVVNARGIRLTGGKETKKIYYRHSGYPGGLREIDYVRLMSQRPVQVVEKAVRGMLPKNRLGRQMSRKLAVYEGPEHPHQAQKPVALGLGEVPAWEGLPTPKPAPRAEPAPPAAGKKARGGAKATSKGSQTKAVAPRAAAGGSKSRASAGTASASSRSAATTKRGASERAGGSAKAGTAKGKSPARTPRPSKAKDKES